MCGVEALRRTVCLVWASTYRPAEIFAGKLFESVEGDRTHEKMTPSRAGAAGDNIGRIRSEIE